VIRFFRLIRGTEQKMKLADLFSQAQKRRRSPKIAEDGTDRSSMAELVRLLQEYEEEEEASGPGVPGSEVAGSKAARG